MDKKGNIEKSDHRFREVVEKIQKVFRAIKKSYLYNLISKFLSKVCTVILVILLIIGAFMFYFKMKSSSYERKGLEYTAPFGLYTIISGSMEPNVKVYDVVVVVDQDISKIKVGDIVTFISTWDADLGLTVTHRVIKVSKNENGEISLTTKGDNNQIPDGAPVTQSNLIGKAVGRIPQLGQLQVLLATKMGWFLIVFIPALAIIIADVIKILKLHVLKKEIDNVKPANKALHSEKDIPLLKGKESIPLKEIPLEEPRIDDTVDTAKLPRIDIDGIIKDSTQELPIIKPKDEPEKEMEDEIELPLLKKQENIITLDSLNIQKNILKKKDE